MKTEIKRMKIKEILLDCRTRCREWVWNFLYEKWIKTSRYGDTVDWKNPGFEHEGKGKQCYARFEPRNASLFLTGPTLNSLDILLETLSWDSEHPYSSLNLLWKTDKFLLFPGEMLKISWMKWKLKWKKNCRVSLVRNRVFTYYYNRSFMVTH